MSEESLYDRLGGVFAIAAVVDKFSDDLLDDPVAGRNTSNPALREWHEHTATRLQGLKFLRTLWVCHAAGGPYKYQGTKPDATELGLTEGHRDLKISSEEFDAAAGVLSRTLDSFGVPETEKNQVLGAFAAHKDEVIAGSLE